MHFFDFANTIDFYVKLENVGKKDANYPKLKDCK